MYQGRFSTIHDHCATCYSLKCSQPPDYVSSCELIECSEGCGMVFHACKEMHHPDVCSSARVPCVNSQFGCNVILKHSEMAAHLSSCLASVVHCGHPITQDKRACNKTIKREEFSFHVKNAHVDISTGILTIHCPLQYQGCQFTCPKLTIEDPLGGHVVYNDILGSHGVELQGYDIPAAGDRDLYLDDLPDTVLEMIIENLDGFSINNLSLTSKYLRSMCESLLYRKGMVEPVWEKSREEGKKWTGTKMKWSFSTATLPIKQWKYQLSTPLNKHLMECPFYQERNSNKCNDEKVPCENGCGLSMTRVKVVEHRKVCQMQIVSCINKHGGCDAEVRRGKMTSHLRICPANILKCISSIVRKEIPDNCHRVFRKGELVGHQKFSHVDLCEETQLSCPLVCDGCDFTINKRTPQVPKADVVFMESSKSFTVGHEIEMVDKNSNDNQVVNVDNEVKGEHISYLESLPHTLLLMIMSYADSLSLYQLSLTCKYLREVCQDLLPYRGMVEPIWEKKEDSWTISKKKWYFSTACSPVQKWEVNLSTPIVEHMKTCQNYQEKNIKTDRVLVMFNMDQKVK